MKYLYIAVGAVFNIAWFVLLGWDGLWIPLMVFVGFAAFSAYDERIFSDPILFVILWVCLSLLSGLLLGVPALPLLLAIGLSSFQYGVLYPRYRALVLGF